MIQLARQLFGNQTDSTEHWKTDIGTGPWQGPLDGAGDFSSGVTDFLPPSFAA